MMPDFSIVVPVYNVEPYLRQCVDSILAQTFPGFELILVDDGSPDGCGAICDEYAARDSRVSVIHQANSGPSAARRNGLGRARGAYVLFADADDWVEPHWLQAVSGCIDAHPGVDIVLYDFTRDVCPAEQPLLAEAGYYDRPRLEAEIFPRMLCDFSRRPFGTQLFPGMLCTRAVKRELLCAHFITDERITVFEDAAMSYDCIWHARSMCVIGEPLYVYRKLEQTNLNHYRQDFFQQLRMGLDYMTATLGGKDPALDRQISGFYARKVIVGVLWELQERGSVPAAARAVAAAMGQTHLAGLLSPAGFPPDMRLYLLLLKMRLYLPAVLLTKWKM